jgi:PIH1 N-terminal domain
LSLTCCAISSQQKGITITPEQGFTLKTKVAPDGVKVFINLCTHGEIDAPSVKKKLNAEGESVEGKFLIQHLCFPLLSPLLYLLALTDQCRKVMIGRVLHYMSNLIHNFY